VYGYRPRLTSEYTSSSPTVTRSVRTTLSTRVHAVNILSVEQHLAAKWSLHGRYRSHERALAGAVRSEKTHKLTGFSRTLMLLATTVLPCLPAS
jgi:hypothetical protein